MKRIFTPILFCAILFFVSDSSVHAATYYISPNGNNSNPGTRDQPWQTFNYALNSTDNPNRIDAGDTLIVRDGTYRGNSINPYRRNGKEGAPITIKAENDGNAIIDGEFTSIPIQLVNNNHNDYYTIEGLVVLNGTQFLHETGGNIFLEDNASHIILRRISSYNAHTDKNTHPIFVSKSSNILIEDCIAAGTGRKMIIMYFSSNITVRRCFANWTEYRGRDFSNHWPNSEGIDLYGTSNSIIENSINFANVPTFGFTIRAKDPGSTANNNKILGSISVYAGLDQHTLEPKFWPDPGPGNLVGPYEDTTVKPDMRVGLRFFGKSDNQINGNTVRDFLAYGNANPGITLGSGIYNANPTNTLIERVTLYGNMVDAKDYYFTGGIKKYIPPGVDFFQDNYSEMTTNGNRILDSYIGRVWDIFAETGFQVSGRGARHNLLFQSYTDGVLDPDKSFWSGAGGTFPMEERARNEYKTIFGIDNFSITNTIKPIVMEAPTGNETPPPTPTQGPTAVPTSTRTPTPNPNEVQPISVTASTHLEPYVAGNAIDNNVSTRWSGEGDGTTLTFDLGTTVTLDLMKIAWHNGESRQSFFDIQVSLDNQNWSTILTNQSSTGTTSNLEEYQLPDTNARYIKFIGRGNTDSLWNSIYEMEFYHTGGSMLSGDTDDDGDVDIFDYNAVLSNFGKTGTLELSDGDLDGDGDVDIFDYNQVVSYFGS